MRKKSQKNMNNMQTNLMNTSFIIKDTNDKVNFYTLKIPRL